jgi:hypothetical protein
MKKRKAAREARKVEIRRESSVLLSLAMETPERGLEEEAEEAP